MQQAAGRGVGEQAAVLRHPVLRQTAQRRGGLARIDRAAEVAYPVGHIGSGHGPRQRVALAGIGAQQGGSFDQVGRFQPFDDHPQAQALRQLHQRADEADGLLGVASGFAHQALIDFDSMKRQGAQAQQAGVATAQIVHHQPHAGGGEVAHRIVAALRIVEFGVFQHFERQAVGGDTGLAQRRFDAAATVLLQQHVQRQVQPQAQAQTLGIPAGDVRQRLRQPAAKQAREFGLAEPRQKLPRHDEAAVVHAQAGEGFDAVRLAGLQIDQGLQMHLQPMIEQTAAPALAQHHGHGLLAAVSVQALPGAAERLAEVVEKAACRAALEHGRVTAVQAEDDDHAAVAVGQRNRGGAANTGVARRLAPGGAGGVVRVARQGADFFGLPGRGRGAEALGVRTLQLGHFDAAVVLLHGAGVGFEPGRQLDDELAVGIGRAQSGRFDPGQGGQPVERHLHEFAPRGAVLQRVFQRDDALLELLADRLRRFHLGLQLGLQPRGEQLDDAPTVARTGAQALTAIDQRLQIKPRRLHQQPRGHAHQGVDLADARGFAHMRVFQQIRAEQQPEMIGLPRLEMIEFLWGEVAEELARFGVVFEQAVKLRDEFRCRGDERRGGDAQQLLRLRSVGLRHPVLGAVAEKVGFDLLPPVQPPMATRVLVQLDGVQRDVGVAQQGVGIRAVLREQRQPHAESQGVGFATGQRHTQR